MSIMYDAAGRRSSVTLPDGVVVSYGYDHDSHVSSITYNNAGGSTIGNLTYAYDGDGRRVNVDGSLAATNIPSPEGFTYNAADELTQFKKGSSVWLLVSRDAAGDITNIDGCPQHFVWDARGHLSQRTYGVTTAGCSYNSQTITNYSYGPFGRRTEASWELDSEWYNSTGSSTYLYDGSNPVSITPNSGTGEDALFGVGMDDLFQETLFPATHTATCATRWAR